MPALSTKLYSDCQTFAETEIKSLLERQALDGFERYLRHERKLMGAAVVNDVPFVRWFLSDRFGDRPVRLSRLYAGDVVHFVQGQVPRLHLKRAKLLTTALRSFLPYARYRGDIAYDLAAACSCCRQLADDLDTARDSGRCGAPEQVPANSPGISMQAMDGSSAASFG